MKAPKTHYAILSIANEIGGGSEWSSSYCGLENTESPFSNNYQKTTCKKCLKKLIKNK